MAAGVRGADEITMNDAKQGILEMWFSHLRWLKCRQLPMVFDDPVVQARHDAAVRDEIERTEKEIERVMNDDQDFVRSGCK